AVLPLTGPVTLQRQQAVSVAHCRVVTASAALRYSALGGLDGELRASEATVHVREPEVERPRQRGVVEPVQPLPVLEEALHALGESAEEVKRESASLRDVKQHAVPLATFGQTLHVNEGLGKMGQRFGVR